MLPCMRKLLGFELYQVMFAWNLFPKIWSSDSRKNLGGNFARIGVLRWNFSKINKRPVFNKGFLGGKLPKKIRMSWTAIREVRVPSYFHENMLIANITPCVHIQSLHRKNFPLHFVPGGVEILEHLNTNS